MGRSYELIPCTLKIHLFICPTFRPSDEVTNIDDEYHTVDDLLKRAECQPESDESSGTSDEIEQTLGKIRRRDELHRLDAAELPEGGLDASSVADIIKKKLKAKDKEERKRRRVQSPTSTVGDKLDRLLDQLPKFLSTAKQAAEAHVKALCKWETKIGPLSSSDTD